MNDISYANITITWAATRKWGESYNICNDSGFAIMSRTLVTFRWNWLFQAIKLFHMVYWLSDWDCTNGKLDIKSGLGIYWHRENDGSIRRKKKKLIRHLTNVNDTRTSATFMHSVNYYEEKPFTLNQIEVAMAFG